MSVLHKLLNPRITMLTSDSANSINGRVVLGGQEWVVKSVVVKSGASAQEKESALINQAIRDYGNDK